MNPSAVAPSTSLPAAIAATPATPMVDPSATVTASTTVASTLTLAYLKSPPNITFPAIPEGFVPLSVARYRAQLPKKEELAYMPEVVTEMGRFADFAEVFGKTAPSHAAASQTLSAAYQWSSLRAKLSSWQTYSAVQEAVAWVQARALIDRLRPAFALAVAGDSSLATNYPNLGQLFGVSKAIAKRGVATRAANKTEIAAGRAPFKGAVGKARKTKAEKAALASQQAAQSAAPKAAQAAAATSSPAPVTPAVVPQASTPVTSVAPAAAAPVPTAAAASSPAPVTTSTVPAAPAAPPSPEATVAHS